MTEEIIHHSFSPSSLERREACPGSAAMEGGLPPVPSSPEAKRGTFLHSVVCSALAGDLSLMEGLPPDDKKAVEWTLAEVRNLVEICGPSTLYREQNLVLLDEKMNVVTRGRGDLIIVPENPEIPIQMIDHKFGSGWLSSPENSLQMIAYSISTFDSWGKKRPVVAHILAGTLEKHLTGNPDLEQGRERILRIVAAGNKPDAPRIPGSHCKWCRGLAHGACRESVGGMMELAKPEIKRQIEVCQDPEKIAAWFSLWKGVKSIGEAIEKRLHEVLEAKGECGPYVRKVSPGHFSISDIVEAWKILSPVISQDEFLGACKASLPTLRKSYVKAKKSLDPEAGTVKELEAEMAAILEPAMKRGSDRVSVVLAEGRVEPGMIELIEAE